MTATGDEGMPLAIATSVLAPVSMPDGTLKFAVEACPRATEVVLKPDVLAKKTWPVALLVIRTIG